MSLSPDHPGAMPDDPDDDHPDIAAEAELQAMREQLTLRINRHTHPSRLINQIGLADLQCSESARDLVRLIGRSPKVLKVMRAELRKAFEVDPDNLLFTEAATPDTPQKVDSLTDRALLLLTRPRVESNVNQFTVLSVRGDPGHRFSLTPLQVLRRVIELRLLERLAAAADKYWDALEQGSWLTRREYWVQLHTKVFAGQVFLARQLDELSNAGMALVQAVIEAPTLEDRQKAGGAWATARVAELRWPGTTAVAIPGALHFYRQGDPSDAPHVIYLPGLASNFHEYPSFAALQCGVPALSRSRLDELWQCLPLNRRSVLCRPADLSPVSTFVRGLEVKGNAVELGALALLKEQWSNELACALSIYHTHVFSKARPQSQSPDTRLFLSYVEDTRKKLVGGARLGALREYLLKWDHQRRRAEVIFASLAPGLALRTVEQHAKRYGKGLLALLKSDDISVGTPAYEAFESLVSQLKVHSEALNGLVQGAQQRLFEVSFWNERPGGKGTARRVSQFMHAQTEALRCEVQLQHQLKLLGTVHRDLVIEVVDQPLASRRPDSQTQVLSIAIGSEPDAFYALHNVWVITTAAALRKPARQLPVVMYALGASGGVLPFAGLDALTLSLKASLNSRDDSVLWGCVERDKRNDLRAHAAALTLGVRFVPIHGKPALAALKKLLGTYSRLHSSTEDITRIFSEVADPKISRDLLMLELEDQLKVPVNRALRQAQANIELLQMVASEAKKLPAWTGASRAQRRQFKRSQQLYVGNALAFLTHLEQRLPDLNTYARQQLTARLRKDGIPATFDIDEPFIAMSGDIHGTYCDYASACALRDPDHTVAPSSSCKAFSVLQLTLHNLDPLASWTQYALNRACFLQAAWPLQISAGYLRQMVSTLDVGGGYDALINTVFYPPLKADRALSDGRIPELLNRALRAGFERDLLAAVQQGLSANAQSIIRAAMSARVPLDLSKSPYKLQLHLVYLVGHTLAHNRYIAGIVVVHDEHSGVCVVYWPQAAQALVLTEYSSLQNAQVELNRLGALPDNVKVLARQVAPGWVPKVLCPRAFNAKWVRVFERVAGAFLVSWKALNNPLSPCLGTKQMEPTVSIDEIKQQILEQIASAPQDWLAVLPTSNSNAQALLYRASVLERQRQTRAASYSSKALEEYRVHRLREGSVATRRMLLGAFVPILGLLFDVLGLVPVLRRYQRSGDPLDKRVAADAIKYFAVNLLSMFIPGAVRPGTVARSVRLLSRGSSSGILRSVPSLMPLPKVLERFKVKGVPEGAIALKGADKKGVYVKDGELFVTDGSGHYPFYQREGEGAFRLKNPEAPGKDEVFVRFRPEHENVFGADIPQPQPGPSSAVLNPWRPPVPVLPDWQPPVLNSARESRILGTANQGTHWHEWRTTRMADQITASVAPDVYQVGANSEVLTHHILRVGPPGAGLMDPQNWFFRVLPPGDRAPLNRIVFIRRDTPLPRTAVDDIERWTTTARDTQPLAASRASSGDWLIHESLFSTSLTDYVKTAFPSMTPTSQTQAVRRLIALSGPEGPATATHLLSIRTTLDNWLTPTSTGVGKTDDLLRMLRTTERGGTTIHVGFDGKAPGFTRVDFQVEGLDPALHLNLNKEYSIWNQRDAAQRVQITRVLEGQGFHVEAISVKRFKKVVDELIATHPSSQSNKVYYVVPAWLEGGTLAISKNRMSVDWFTTALMQNPNLDALVNVKRALEQQRLILIVAGVQWPVMGTVPPSVYFIKVNFAASSAKKHPPPRTTPH